MKRNLILFLLLTGFMLPGNSSAQTPFGSGRSNLQGPGSCLHTAGFPERIAYAVSDRVEGPYTYQGILNEIAGNSNTNHQAIVEFKGEWYFFYHNGALQREATSFSRSVCVDRLYHNPDGTIQRIVMTSEGVKGLPDSVVWILKGECKNR